MTSDPIRPTPADLVVRVTAALEHAGTRSDNAASVARALVAAEVDGQAGHGLSRVESYAAQVRAKKIDGHATPTSTRPRQATLAIDAAHGFAYPALDLAVAELPAVARTSGIAAAAIHRSHHAGALGLTAERLADAGLVTLMFANTPAAMAPWGGRRALFGTNPIAFAAPVPAGPPLLVDLALSEVARGKIMAAAEAGKPIPLGWATDRHGQPTTDARAALAGTLQPAGGAKGSALALMVEVLAAALTGGSFAAEASSFLDASGPPPSTGQLIVAIDPLAFPGGARFAERLASLAHDIAVDGDARLPGSRRLARRREVATHGLAVPTSRLEALDRLAGR